ncbi:MAG: PaaI family thioesterase [Bacteroidales bacterium]
MIPDLPTIEQLNALNQDTLMGALGMEYLEVKAGYVYARMPVDERTMQPAGILHGGSSLALAETLAGIGSVLLVDPAEHEVRGAHITANHVLAGKGHWVFGKATIIHQGRNTHLWNIDIFDQDEKLISTCRITNFIIKKNTQKP